MRYGVLVFVPLALLAAASGAAPQAAVSGGVIDATTGRDLSGVTVTFGPHGSVVSDAKGDFALGKLAPGKYAVRLSHDGYGSKLLHVVVDRGDHELYLAVVLVPLVAEGDSTALHTDTTSVVAYGDYAGFYRRRHEGNGYFFTRRDIERIDPHRMTDLLRSIPGAWFRYDRRGEAYVSFHLGANPARGCQPAIYLDGGRAGTMMSLDELVHLGHGDAPAHGDDRTAVLLVEALRHELSELGLELP